MTNDSGLSVKFDGDPRATEIRYNGELVPATEAHIYLSATQTTVTVELSVQKLETMGGHVEWYGLEDIPTNVLESVVEQRRNGK